MLADVALLLLDLAVKIIDFVRDALFVSFIGSTSEISPGILQALLQRVQPLYRRSLDIREKVLGPEHPEVAASLNQGRASR